MESSVFQARSSVQTTIYSIIIVILIVLLAIFVLEFSVLTLNFVGATPVNAAVGLLIAYGLYKYNQVQKSKGGGLDAGEFEDFTCHNCSELTEENKCIECKNGGCDCSPESKNGGLDNEKTHRMVEEERLFIRDEKFKIVHPQLEFKNGGFVKIPKIPKNIMAQILLAVKSAVHVGAGTTAAVASLGMGGDTIVDILFIALSAAEMMATITQFIYGMATASVSGEDGQKTNLIAEISRLGFATGPMGVANSVRDLLKRVPNLVEICSYMTSAFDQIISIAMTVLSAFIPDDAGTISVAGAYGGKLVTAAVGSPLWYASIIGIFELIPAQLRKYVTQPEELRGLFLRIIEFVQTTVLSADKTFLQKMSMFAAGATASGLAASSVLVGFMAPPIAAAGLTTSLAIQTANVAIATDSGRKYLRDVLEDVKPNLDVAVDVVFTSLPLLFGCAIVLQQCAAQ